MELAAEFCNFIIDICNRDGLTEYLGMARCSQMTVMISRGESLVDFQYEKAKIWPAINSFIRLNAISCISRHSQFAGFE